MARKLDPIHDPRGTQKDDRPHRAQLLWTFMVAITVGVTAFHQLGSPPNALLQDSRIFQTPGPMTDLPGVAHRPMDPYGYMPPSASNEVTTVSVEAPKEFDLPDSLPLPKSSRKVRRPSSTRSH
jgi:hypothetical protein